MAQLSLRPARLRQRNRARVLLEIYKGHAVTRTQIAEVLGLSVMALTRIVRELVAAGLVEEGPKSTLNPLGRPSTKLALSGAGGYVVGLSLSAYEPCVSLLNIRGELVLRRPIELNSLRKAQYAVAASSRVIEKLIADAGIPPRRVLGLGTVVAGVVDNRKGVVLAAPYLGLRRYCVAAAANAWAAGGGGKFEQCLAHGRSPVWNCCGKAQRTVVKKRRRNGRQFMDRWSFDPRPPLSGRSYRPYANQGQNTGLFLRPDGVPEHGFIWQRSYCRSRVGQRSS